MIYSSKNKQICAICKKEFTHNRNGQFTNHLWNNHKKTLHQYLIEYFYSKNDLGCKICGNQVNLRRGIPNEYCNDCFRSAKKIQGFKVCTVCGKEFEYKNSTEYKNKTCSKECRYKIVSQKLKDFNNNLSIEKKARIKKKMESTKILNGSTNKNKIPWNKGKTGIYSEETLEKIRNATLKQFSNSSFKKTSCELQMEKILKDLEITYEYSFVINDRQYDYLLKDTRILIECDGDFWHGNLSTGKYKELSYIQEQNQINDIYKTALAQEAGYFLFRFWEYEIMNYEDNVKERLETIVSILKDNQQPS